MNVLNNGKFSITIQQSPPSKIMGVDSIMLDIQCCDEGYIAQLVSKDGIHKVILEATEARAIALLFGGDIEVIPYLMEALPLYILGRRKIARNQLHVYLTNEAGFQRCICTCLNTNKKYEYSFTVKPVIKGYEVYLATQIGNAYMSVVNEITQDNLLYLPLVLTYGQLDYEGLIK